MTTLTWRGGNGHWSDQSQWTPRGEPQAGSAAVLGAGSYTVTLDSIGTAATITVAAGATLDVTGELDLTGPLALASGAALALDGLITGGTIVAGSGAIAVSGGTLEGVAVKGGLAGLAGLTVDSATIAQSVAAGGTVAVAGTLSLLHGTYAGVTFALDQTGGGTTVLAAADSGGVTLDAGTVVALTQDAAVVTYPLASTMAGLAGPGTITNLGLITSDVGNPAGSPLLFASTGFVNGGTVLIAPLQVQNSITGIVGYNTGPHGLRTPVMGTLNWTAAYAPTLEIASDTFDNTGTLALSGGTLDLTGTDVRNSGVIALADSVSQTVTADALGVESITTGPLPTLIDIGAGVTLFDNLGTLTADTIEIDGSVTLSGLGTLHGTLVIAGTLDLGGGTLDASQFGGVIVTGTIEGGTLLPGSGSVTLESATLDGVMLGTGSLTETGAMTLIDPPFGASVTLDSVTTALHLSGGSTSLGIVAGSPSVTDWILLPSGGSETLDAASTLSATVAGSTVEIGAADATLADWGTIAVANATVVVQATLDGATTIAIGPAGAVTLDALAATAAPTVTFADGTGTLVLPGTGALGVTIATLQPGDVIDFATVSSTPSGPFGIGGAAASGGSLFVTGASGDSASLAVAGTTAGLSFHVIPDGAGGSLVEVACFAAGTRIATPDGELPVQALRPGTLVRLAEGGIAPVRWVGSTCVDLSRHPDPARAAPIRLRAGALGPGVPARDLWVSPEHCLLIGGVLIPAGLLANGASIARDDSFGRIAYWHVELDRHGVLLAEGAAAESYLDTGNRALFNGQAGVRALHPDLAAAPDAAALAIWATHAAAPLCLDAADQRAALTTRAETLGWQLTSDAGPMLANERGGLAVSRHGHSLRALLPAGTARLLLTSRSFVPMEHLSGSGDRRRLGVAVRAARLAGWPLHPDAFAAGWHKARAGEAWRWSDGAASIVLPRLTKPTALELTMAGSYHYWVAPPQTQWRHPALPMAMGW